MTVENIEITDAEGVFLVGLARKAVEEYLKNRTIIKPPKDTPEVLKRNMGVFVTIETLRKVGEKVKKELRGCIGFPLPIKPLVNATIEAAIAAATEDPRFPPMTYDEVGNVVFEVSILTPPEEIKVEKPREYLDKIVIGRDGLIVERGLYKGLLLPQVPVEYKWDVMTFLGETCMKAGLPPDAWTFKDTKIYKFQAIVYAELEPKGRVVKRDLIRELKEE